MILPVAKQVFCVVFFIREIRQYFSYVFLMLVFMHTRKSLKG